MYSYRAIMDIEETEYQAYSMLALIVRLEIATAPMSWFYQLKKGITDDSVSCR